MLPYFDLPIPWGQWKFKANKREGFGPEKHQVLELQKTRVLNLSLFFLFCRMLHVKICEPRKKPWLVGIYRGLYYPVIQGL